MKRLFLFFLILFTCVFLSAKPPIIWGPAGSAKLLTMTLENSAGTSFSTGGNEFADSVFRLQDNADATKELALEVSGIATGTTRTWTVPDSNINMADISTNTTHSSGDGSDHADVATNTTHSTGSGSDHSDVALNTTHRSSAGTDHSDVGLNNTHRTGDGSDHADVATNTTHSTGNGSDHANVATNTTHSSGDGSDHADVASNTSALTGKASTTLNNLGTTNINASLLFDADAVYNIGIAAGNRLNSVNAGQIDADSNFQLKTSGNSVRMAIFTGQSFPSGIAGTRIQGLSDEIGITQVATTSTVQSFGSHLEGGDCVNSSQPCGGVVLYGGRSTGSAADGTVEVDGVLELKETIIALTADDQNMDPDTSYIGFTSDNATSTLRTFTISLNAQKGAILTLCQTSANASELLDSGNVNIAGTMTFGQGDCISLISNGSIWFETARSDN